MTKLCLYNKICKFALVLVLYYKIYTNSNLLNKKNFTFQNEQKIEQQTYLIKTNVCYV